MARKAIAKDQIVKLIVGAGQASPSPPVGPALGSKGVKSMDFCKVTSPPHHYRQTVARTQVVLTCTLGVQCKNSTIYGRDSNTGAHNSAPRPFIPLPAPHTTHRHAPTQRCWRTTHQEQDTRRWQCPRSNEQSRWAKGKDVYEQSDSRQCDKGNRGHG